jgi:hypothetical protein
MGIVRLAKDRGCSETGMIPGGRCGVGWGGVGAWGWEWGEVQSQLPAGLSRQYVVQGVLLHHLART